MREILVKIPENLASKVDLLLEIEGRGFDDLVFELLATYTEQFVKSMSQKRNKEFMPQKQEEVDRMVITSRMIEVAYETAKEVYEGKLSRTEGKRKIHRLSGMKEGSAQDYIGDFLAMMNGSIYHRTMSAEATEYFLRGIYADYGEGKFKAAVEATRKHLKYYATVSTSTSPKRKRLLDQLEQEFL